MPRDYEGMQAFETAIGRGEVEWAEPIYAYGRYAASGAITNQVIWPDGAYSYPPSVGVQLSIASTSAEDDSAGTGVRTIDIHYLDSNLIPRVEALALDGLTPVSTVATNIRFIQCMHILTAGSAKSAVGTISATTGGVIYSQIAAGSRRCSSTARMVPAGKKMYVAGAVGGSSSGTAAARAEVKISSTYFDGHNLTDQAIFMPFGSITMQDNAIPYSFPLPAGPFPEGTVVLMEVTVDKAATVTGNWFGWLENA